MLSINNQNNQFDTLQVNTSLTAKTTVTQKLVVNGAFQMKGAESGKMLTGDDSNNVIWADIVSNTQDSVITTVGDIIRGSITGQPERLAMGPENHFLCSGGETVNWARPRHICSVVTGSGSGFTNPNNERSFYPSVSSVFTQNFNHMIPPSDGADARWTVIPYDGWYEVNFYSPNLLFRNLVTYTFEIDHRSTVTEDRILPFGTFLSPGSGVFSAIQPINLSRVIYCRQSDMVSIVYRVDDAGSTEDCSMGVFTLIFLE